VTSSQQHVVVRQDKNTLVLISIAVNSLQDMLKFVPAEDSTIKPVGVLLVDSMGP